MFETLLQMVLQLGLGNNVLTTQASPGQGQTSR